MKHLSPEQISSVVAGIEVSEEAHVRECAACAMEVDRMKTVLMQFRGSVRDWSEKLNHSEFPVQEAIVSRVHGAYARRRASMAWVLATAALAAAVAIPAYRESREQELKVQAQRDDQLLMDVNAHLSRSGPQAMDSLMRMMSTEVYPDSDSFEAQENRGESRKGRSEMKRMGKSIGMLIGIGLMTSTVPVWAQSPVAVSARQADVAAAKAQLEAAQAKAKAAEAASSAASVKKPVPPVPTVAPLAPRNPIESPYGQTEPYYTTQAQGLNVQWTTRSGKDPLSALQVAPGTWWNNTDTATRLALTKEQQRKMDDIFQQFRLTLIDLNASLSKEELILDPLIAAERIDEVKILTQIDRIAQARAELEKANSRMLLGIRQSLTMEQWSKIQASPATYRLTIRR